MQEDQFGYHGEILDAIRARNGGSTCLENGPDRGAAARLFLRLRECHFRDTRGAFTGQRLYCRDRETQAESNV